MPVHVKKERWPSCDGSAFWNVIAPVSFTGLDMNYIGINIISNCDLASIESTALFETLEFSFEIIFTSINDSLINTIELIIEVESLMELNEIWDITLVDYSPLSLFEVLLESEISPLCIEASVDLQELPEDAVISSTIALSIELYSVETDHEISNLELNEIAWLQLETINNEFNVNTPITLSSTGILAITLNEIVAYELLETELTNDIEFMESFLTDGYENDWRWWFLEINGPYL